MTLHNYKKARNYERLHDYSPSSVQLTIESYSTKKSVDGDTTDEDDIDEDIFDQEAEEALHAVDPSLESPPATKFGLFRRKLKQVIEHFLFRLFSLLLIIIDICILIVELAQINKGPTELRPYEIASLCFVSYFVFEVCLRILAKGPSEFFREWLNIIDLVVVVSAFTVTVLYMLEDFANMPGATKLVVVGRLIRIVMFVRLYTEKKNVEKGARHMVSQNKRRYQKDGFDLDLTYVTERVIAMSFPSAGKMSVYRNPIGEVARFLDTKHPNHYKVYNLCSERTYDDTYFHGRVERYLIDDHNVPSLKDVVRFATSVREWLAFDPENVIAVHCKGGKGRTGTMICVWLVESGLFESAGDSLNYFGFRRTDLSVGSKYQGVETPSQSRYVGYHEHIKDKLDNRLPEEVPLKIKKMKITALAGLGKGNGSDFTCEIFIGRNIKVFDCVFGSDKNCQATYNSELDFLEVVLTNCPVLIGDVKMRFQSTSRNIPRGYEKVPFYLWFHTSFIQDLRLLIKRNELDNPHKPKTWQWFREKFSVELFFSEPSHKSTLEEDDGVIQQHIEYNL